MSYKLENLTFTNKKPDIKLVNFSAQSQAMANIYLPHKKDRHFMANLLRGQERLAYGRYRIDGSDLVGGRFVKSRVAFIKNDKWIERLIPPRVILTTSQLFDIKFIRQARLKRNDKKFNYLSFADSKNDLQDIALRQELDKVISHFLDNLTEVEKNLIRNFQIKIRDFNNQQAKKIFADYYKQIQVLVHEYTTISLKIIINNLLMTFYQTLWDQIYSFKDLRNSCPCEYNVRKSSNKDLKKIIYKFTYRQPYFMVEKRLKTLNIRISDLRFQLFKDKHLAKQIRKQLSYEIQKFNQHQNVSKEAFTHLHSQIDNWEKIVKDITSTFEKSQRDFFYETLPKEGAIARQRLIFLTHQYHKVVLAGQNEIGNQQEFKALKKHYKGEIKGIYQQAANQTKENLELLNIKFDWYLKSGFKLSSLNIIYIKILRAIYLKKNNIVFDEILNLLTRDDFKALQKTMKNLTKVYPELTFINLTANIQSIGNWEEPIFSINADHELKSLSPSVIVKLNAKQIASDLPNMWNTFNYLKSEGGIAIGKTIWDIPQLKPTPNHKIFLNPFMVRLEPPTEVIHQEMIPMIIKVKKQSKFLDPRMQLGVTKSGVKIIFYAHQPLENNRERVIFIENKGMLPI